MPRKGKRPSQKAQPDRTTPTPPGPSIPLPDDPALRDESERLREGARALEEQAALLRLKALEQARKMPAPPRQKPEDNSIPSSQNSDEHEDKEQEEGSESEEKGNTNSGEHKST